MIVFSVESFTANIEEIKQIIPEHYDALALDKEHVPLSPRWDQYMRMDADGGILFITARELGKLVGYFVGFIGPGLHYSTCLTLSMDVLWLTPSRRKGLAGFKLVKAIEAEAKRRGVQRVFLGWKLHAPALGTVLDRLGYRPIEMHASKWIGD